MAEFYGSVQGARGEATRLGHGNTGLRTSAQSWEGSIIVNIYKNGSDGPVCVDISVTPDSAKRGGHTLYSGPIKNLFDDQINFGR
jgi:hypothetical protein